MTTSTTIELRIRAVIFEEGPYTVVQCLEHDIAAQGRSLREAQENFERVFAANVVIDLEAGRTPLARLGPAPERYHRLFDGSRFRSAPETLPIGQIPPPWVIHAVAQDVRIFA